MPVYRSILRTPLGDGREFNVVKVNKSGSIKFVLMHGENDNPVQERIRVEIPMEAAVRIAKFIMGLRDALPLPGITEPDEDPTEEDTDPGRPPREGTKTGH